MPSLTRTQRQRGVRLSLYALFVLLVGGLVLVADREAIRENFFMREASPRTGRTSSPSVRATPSSTR
ncbi:hypothetical protein [Serinicoccus sp. CNJ-927]|uniref:hypothetical protein n=1 Tax=Serinicoccus sp. CNJ-927 TaxID=1904970 RepID=UPI001ED9EC44|nr:hypothetical protein [Serinicoccus sp. CNJ-927]